MSHCCLVHIEGLANKPSGNAPMRRMPSHHLACCTVWQFVVFSLAIGKQKGTHPPAGNPLMYLFDGGCAEKVVTFFNNISQTKISVWGLNKVVFHGRKAVKTRLYEVKS
jgi:hypothetical protein